MNWTIATLLFAFVFSCTTIKNSDNDTPDAENDLKTDLNIVITGGDVAEDFFDVQYKEEEMDIPDGEDLSGEEFDKIEHDTPKEAEELVEEGKGEEVFDVDVPCIPNCEGKVCGSDGCDGICGFCSYGYFCSQDGTKCEEMCMPINCQGLTCGFDGCGGFCGAGPCSGDFICIDPEGKCKYDECNGFNKPIKGYYISQGKCSGEAYCKDVKWTCIPKCEGLPPNCADKQCGVDECGNSCGECAPGYICSWDNICVKGPCQGVNPNTGACDKNMLLLCENNNLIKIDCSTEDNKVCGWDPWILKYNCIDKPPCKPKCTFPDGSKKECGDDGCGAKCGTCPSGWACQQGICRPVDGAPYCGYIPEWGYCWNDNYLYWCCGSTICSENCTASGKVCTYDLNTQQFACK